MDAVKENKQTVLLESKVKLTIDGVINVESFNDDYMELSTNLGEISVEGENLKIEELRQENGKILITGEVNGIYYKSEKHLAVYLEYLNEIFYNIRNIQVGNICCFIRNLIRLYV